jgi:hypothetical protein
VERRKGSELVPDHGSQTTPYPFIQSFQQLGVSGVYDYAGLTVSSPLSIADRHVAFRESYDVGVLIGCFRSSIPSPPITLFTLR